MNNIANEDAEIGAKEVSGEENEEEAQDLYTGRVQRRIEEWMMAKRECSQAPVGESGAATGEVGDTFRAAVEVSCIVILSFWKICGGITRLRIKPVWRPISGQQIRNLYLSQLTTRLR